MPAVSKHRFKYNGAKSLVITQGCCAIVFNGTTKSIAETKAKAVSPHWPGTSRLVLQIHWQAQRKKKKQINCPAAEIFITRMNYSTSSVLPYWVPTSKAGKQRSFIINDVVAKQHPAPVEKSTRNLQQIVRIAMTIEMPAAKATMAKIVIRRTRSSSFRKKTFVSILFLDNLPPPKKITERKSHAEGIERTANLNVWTRLEFVDLTTEPGWVWKKKTCFLLRRKNKKYKKIMFSEGGKKLRKQIRKYKKKQFFFQLCDRSTASGNRRHIMVGKLPS